ncbi:MULTISPECIES: CCRG-2 family RiPP [Prochlorococcus]|uniref:CCRG-2 family RiPP n=1 Tax=Prochlorococcus TaxID=1218 RepID=UPI0007B3A8B4|nr:MULTISPECIES: CCRG-2 family RiPP [Prochlorococcus]KZR62593.1 hypothetical protein PMIT1312_02059 [Prochlorococcus marinus str. MIT 1312]KZR80925.1 hypothetical protein PMIT1327_01373 [Prochlorococcus marinus str. MIT 1327]NMO84149.1 CCRG-2 family RiPP [Prochlorococcus sp. P1344]NMP05559.1 CCRG-2 family RiPP [Prochlorococcus sp. P1361]NMP12509.1 CCRG-2 family RiPP [Prochlorococcus sp.P1363]
MADPKENEEPNEELSIDELKAVSGGGLASSPIGKKELNWGEICDVGASVRAEGSGSGMTKADFERANKTGVGGEYYNE